MNDLYLKTTDRFQEQILPVFLLCRCVLLCPYEIDTGIHGPTGVYTYPDTEVIPVPTILRQCDNVVCIFYKTCAKDTAVLQEDLGCASVPDLRCVPGTLARS